MTKGLEKAKEFFRHKGGSTAHPPKQHLPKENVPGAGIKEPNQKALSQAAKEGKALEKQGVTAEAPAGAPPAKASGNDGGSGQFRAVEKDKPAYNPTLPDARAKAKENDKGLSR